jgi:hypothetical protein
MQSMIQTTPSAVSNSVSRTSVEADIVASRLRERHLKYYNGPHAFAFHLSQPGCWFLLLLITRSFYQL